MTADLPTMDAESVDELHALRMRAYGPAADIDDDPDAMRRLEELEARHTLRAATLDDAEVIESVGVAPERNGGPAPSPQPETRQIAPPAEVAEIVAAPPWRLAPGFKLLWAFSVVAAALIAASIAWSVAYLAPVSVSSGAEQIATLTPARDIDVPPGWFGAGASSQTWEYFGLVIFESTYAMDGSRGNRCFAIVAQDQLPEPGTQSDGWSVSGGYWTGCGLGSFPATTELRIGSEVPEELRSQFPDGTALQFVLDGDKVGVFLDPAE